jgi:aconitate hydratase
VTSVRDAEVLASTPSVLVRAVYEQFMARVQEARVHTGVPLTMTEKLLLGHLDRPAARRLRRGEDHLALRPDRLAMPDSSAQTAFLQFMTTGLDRVAVPTTVHCDHLVEAHRGASADLLAAQERLGEVYGFLEGVCASVGAGYWEPGSGIIHQVVLENYAFPGCLLVGTDSHTQNGGGLGMLACGVGGAEAVDVMAGGTWGVRMPLVIGVRLTGSLQGWATPKDVILALAGILTVEGGTGAVLEYFGPGAATISATGKATICNMGTETGATSSLFPYDEAMSAYLDSTGRQATARLADERVDVLRADPEVESDPERFYDRVIELDLDRLEPQITGPGRPDRARPVSQMAAEAHDADFPIEITNALIGSCTNSSYEDIGAAAHVARQARAAGLRVKVPLMVSPGSDRALSTLRRDGLLADLEAIGATILASACGPCIGQWRRTDDRSGSVNSIISSFNRNFPRRNDGTSHTQSFLASPSTVVLAALAGRLDFDPLTDALDGAVPFLPPHAASLPERGWEDGAGGFRAPPGEGSRIEVAIDPESERLQPVALFARRNQSQFADMPVLLKVDGRCTTDHISPAGPWLSLRGHLERLSQNIFLGAVNAYTESSGEGIDQLDGQQKPLSVIAAHYREQGLGWLVVGDENYGEGSSREHAAMSPRYMGASVVLARSFARIHEANLKKQAVLPLVFEDPDDRDLLGSHVRVDVVDVSGISPDQPVRLRVRQDDGQAAEIITRHTLTADEIGWLWAGSALNTLVAQVKDRHTAGQRP